MKIKNLIFCLICACVSSAYAQEGSIISLGLRGGINAANFGGSASSNIGSVASAGSNRYKAGANFGAFGFYSVDEHWAVGAEINYSQKGTAPAINASIKLNYLDIPLYVNYFFGQGGDRFRTKVFLGPYLDILMTAKNRAGGQEIDVKNIYNGTDFGLIAGGGFHYKFNEASDNWLVFDVRYGMGFSDIIRPNIGRSNLTNRMLSINLGVTFPIGD